MYIGDRQLGELITFTFNSYGTNSAPIAPSSAFAASDIKIYRITDGTVKSTSNGISVISPFDSITGQHRVAIDTSNASGDVGFWASGYDYESKLVTAKTVNSISVSGAFLSRFSLQNRYALLSDNAITSSKIVNGALNSKGNWTQSGFNVLTDNNVIAAAVRSGIATELGRIDATISSRLASSSYVSPYNDIISGVFTQTTNLFNNQNNWLTATGFATPANITASENSVINAISGLNILALSGQIQSFYDETMGYFATISGQNVTTYLNVDNTNNNLMSNFSGTNTTIAVIPTEVNNFLGANHGSGSWTTATGFSTPSDITVSQNNILAAIPSSGEISSSVNYLLSSTHGNGQWDSVADLSGVTNYLVAISGDIQNIDVAVDYSQINSGVWSYPNRTLTSFDADGAGYVPITITTKLTNGDILPQVRVEVTPDTDKENLITAGDTDQIGTVTFYLESGNSYYFWRYKNGYAFTNPMIGLLNGPENITWL